MDRHSTPAARVRRSRAERQRETRDALTLAALVAFARDGYHGASLEAIAGDAGFSKGAVYSNFGGKAELFLAVMDYSLQTLRGDDWDPFAAAETGDDRAPQQGEPGAPEQGQTGAAEQGEADAAEMVRGFGLATLEFITTAARDASLIDSLRARSQVLIDAYERAAAARRPPGEDLPADDVARLMAALDQGISVLALSGVASAGDALLRTGLRRLVDPANAANEPPPARDDTTSRLPDVDRVQRLIHDTSEP
ncbi:TetR/AcrR family transcriptional regulator [Actinomadura sp. 7K507]|uniref:TetR/AcrR family transcriptional regulator n=1 Tax=Actinomadura sp. 7K507 TaxID=2530365 RepID=UPI00104B5E5A|nr:TetR/AcrR family transcriptional regulator [Actinomadura sp. 7K507]TDC93054.1 TetR/AcrR family transcriptional regulator [Actinomadura sp. 7K507]